MEKLAIEGGHPVNTDPFPAWPSFSDKTYSMIAEPLKTAKLNYWSGEYGRKFESALAQWHDAKYCVTTVNEFGAFHMALAALGVGIGDEVICPSYIYFPPVFAILQMGAVPVFVDTDRSHTIDPRDVANKITGKTKAIIAAHMYGIVSDMDPLMDLAAKHNLFVIEDCTECFGGLYKGKKTGTVGHVGCFNLCHTKHLVTGGEGGAILTNDESVYKHCFSLRDYGFDTTDGLDMIRIEHEKLYIHNKIGFNYRMSEIQSVIGLCELERMDGWNLPGRRKNGLALIEAMKGHPLVLEVPFDSDERQNSFWWAPFALDIEKVSVPVKQFVAALCAEGVPAFGALWPELYKEDVLIQQNGAGRTNHPFGHPDTTQIDYSKVECPNSKWLAERTISFFAHPIYEPHHIDKYVEAFNKVAGAYTK